MPDSEITKPLTPMLVQYLEIKKNHPDAVLLYRMGDFYELFFEDAVKAAPILEVVLTSRDRSAASPIPMCGVPYHSVTNYLQKLLARGLKVAICEQMEDPSTAKGIVRREVTRVLTPSLIGDPELVSEESQNLLLAIWEEKSGAFEVGYLDLLGSEIRVGLVPSSDQLLDYFLQWNPKELLIPTEFRDRKWVSDFIKISPALLCTERSDYFQSEAKTHGALLQYLRETQKISDLSHIGEPLPLFAARAMQLDSTTLASLEILRNANTKGDEGTVFEALNYTVTPMGRRTLREWLTHPLGELKAIESRLVAVDEFVNDAAGAQALREPLAQIRDLERLTTKTALGLAMPRDIVAIREILKQLPAIKKQLGHFKAKVLSAANLRLQPLEKLTARLEAALEDSAPATLRDGGIFRASFNPEIAEYRSLSTDAKSTIAAIENREKKRTGISSLKVKYSKVFGYTLEITKSYLDRVPAEYIRKQTIANGERFITEELKKFEEKVISADHKLRSLEESLFGELRREVAGFATALLANSRVLGELDVLVSFARAARERNYVRPKLHAKWDLEIDEGRHPVVEKLLPAGKFVPNSVAFSESCRTLIITGPNMGGKSTIMRQTALLALMAHVGSFIPARSAKIPLVDAIFTRIGSSDDLSGGRSTFMVEMTEVGRILKQATARSLILIDEIGRGTSTYDGLSLAWSLLEFIHNDLRAKTLFATHFHELTLLEKQLPELKNCNVLVKKWKDEIIFLYKLAPGVCQQSYGIEVARLAGLPNSVLGRAREILGVLESLSQRANRGRSRALELHENQLAFFDELKTLETRPELGG